MSEMSPKPLERRVGEMESQHTARVLARAVVSGVDVRDLAARLWEIPGEATPAEVQVLAACIVARSY